MASDPTSAVTDSARLEAGDRARVGLSVVLVSDSAAELAAFLPMLRETLAALDVPHEVVMVDQTAGTDARALAAEYGARLVERPSAGYGLALRAGLDAARGATIATLDPDLAHPPDMLRRLWEARHDAGMVIASRYLPGARSRMAPGRALISRALNVFFRRGLSVQIRDTSSAFRLYRADLLRQIDLTGAGYAVLQEIVVKAFCEGWTIREVPFDYRPVPGGRSDRRTVAVGLAYLRTFWAMYRLRNSILSADYDDRAYYSLVPPQRYWQRQRYKHVTGLTEGEGSVLDVGSGSSRIIGSLPQGSVAVDVLFRKLRYARKFGAARVLGSGFALPFPAESFPCVLCSQVIEHVPKDSPILSELRRVLAPGGALVLGTPDYANWEWRVTEAIYDRVLPSAYADEHISHYSREELVATFETFGYEVEATRYILNGELILKFRKPA
jgi:dolichol-phosphate mannosyltransferase